MKTKKITSLALYTAIAMSIFIVELMLPTLAPIPGMKLGLANIVTLVLLCFYTPKETFFVLIARIILGCLLTGKITAFFYSLAGGICCFATMTVCVSLLKGEALVLCSMFGAIAHNIGQILIAYVIVGSSGVFAYFPILMISGMIAGAFTGLAAGFTVKQLKKCCWNRFN